MSEEAKRTVRSVFESQLLAALGTLHANEPSVSMVPFAWTGEGSLVIHVSRLSAHTADMLAHPRVSVLVIDGAAREGMPQAVPRVTVEGDAEPLEKGSPEEVAARGAYEARFPEASMMFELGDFSLFAIRPRRARVIGGLGRAETLSAAEFVAALE